MTKLEERIKNYWTMRAQDFSAVRRMELQDEISVRWVKEITKHLPANEKLRILDVGTGAGYFAVLLAKLGHAVSGIDLTPAMIEEAKKLADEAGLSIDFSVMDAQNLAFADESFDVVISRNVVWTLPEPQKAYGEWLRVLVKGGILLTFDADYGMAVSCRQKETTKAAELNRFHCGVTEKLKEESDQITKAMNLSQKPRPAWDLATIKEMGCRSCYCDLKAGERILRDDNDVNAPIFLIAAEK